MAYGKPSWLVAHLMGEEAARQVNAQVVKSTNVLFSSTSGPRGGIGGAAMTMFQMTLIVGKEHVFVFADEELFGWQERTQVPDLSGLMSRWDTGNGITGAALGGLVRGVEQCPVKINPPRS